MSQFTSDQVDSLTAEDVFPDYPWCDESEINVTSFDEDVRKMVDFPQEPAQSEDIECRIKYSCWKANPKSRIILFLMENLLGICYDIGVKSTNSYIYQTKLTTPLQGGG